MLRFFSLLFFTILLWTLPVTQIYGKTMAAQSQNSPIHSIESVSELVVSQGAGNVSFAVVVVLLVVVLGYILKNVPKQLEEERLFFRDELQREREDNKLERSLDRSEFDRRQRELINKFEYSVKQIVLEVKGLFRGDDSNG